MIVIGFDLHLLHFAVVVLHHEFFDCRSEQLLPCRGLHVERVDRVERVNMLELSRTGDLSLEAHVQHLDRAKRRRHMLVRHSEQHVIDLAEELIRLQFLEEVVIQGAMGAQVHQSGACLGAASDLVHGCVVVNNAIENAVWTLHDRVGARWH